MNFQLEIEPVIIACCRSTPDISPDQLTFINLKLEIKAVTVTMKEAKQHGSTRLTPHQEKLMVDIAKEAVAHLFPYLEINCYILPYNDNGTKQRTYYDRLASIAESIRDRTGKFLTIWGRRN